MSSRHVHQIADVYFDMFMIALKNWKSAAARSLTFIVITRPPTVIAIEPFFFVLASGAAWGLYALIRHLRLRVKRG